MWISGFFDQITVATVFLLYSQPDSQPYENPTTTKTSYNSVPSSISGPLVTQVAALDPSVPMTPSSASGASCSGSPQLLKPRGALGLLKVRWMHYITAVAVVDPALCMVFEIDKWLENWLGVHSVSIEQCFAESDHRKPSHVDLL